MLAACAPLTTSGCCWLLLYTSFLDATVSSVHLPHIRAVKLSEQAGFRMAEILRYDSKRKISQSTPNVYVVMIFALPFLADSSPFATLDAAQCRVREQSVSALVDIIEELMRAKCMSDVDMGQLLTIVTAALLRQALERIARVRQAAASCLRSLLAAQVCF
jgi:hypothetical protein